MLYGVHVQSNQTHGLSHDDEGIGDVYDAVRDGCGDYIAVLELKGGRGNLVCGDPHGKEGIGHVHGAVGIDVAVHVVEVKGERIQTVGETVSVDVFITIGDAVAVGVGKGGIVTIEVDFIAVSEPIPVRIGQVGVGTPADFLLVGESVSIIVCYWCGCKFRWIRAAVEFVAVGEAVIVLVHGVRVCADCGLEGIGKAVGIGVG